MSYADLSKIVGIRTASIHYYFPKKDDLLKALISESHTLYGEHFFRIADGSGSAPDKLQQIIDLYYQGLCNDKMCFIGILSTEVLSLSSEIRAALNDTTEQNIHIFEGIISRGMQSGELIQTRNSYDAAYAFNSIILGAQILSRCSGNTEQYTATMKAFMNSIRV